MRHSLVLILAASFTGVLLAQNGLLPGKPQLPTPEPTLFENLRTFDPQEVRLHWSNRHWLLIHQGDVLKDFGLQQQEAQQALRLIKDLKLNQIGTVGSSQVIMEYWLSNGHAPYGTIHAGVRTMPIDSTRLKVEQIQGQWCLREGNRALFTFGREALDAKQALGIMHKYRFDEVAIVGQVRPSMYVFLARPHVRTGENGPVPALGINSKQASPQRFSRLAKNSDGSTRTEKIRSLPTGGLEGVVNPLLPRPTTASLPKQKSATQWRTQPAMGYQGAHQQGDRLTFDWRQVQLRQDNNEWKIVAGTAVLANFGTNLQNARIALQAIRYYRFNEQWQVGEEKDQLNCFLAPGTSPRALMLGLHGETFQPNNLKLQKADNAYTLTQGDRVLFRVSQEHDAMKLLERIKQNRCDQVCRIGSPEQPTMTILVRTR